MKRILGCTIALLAGPALHPLVAQHMPVYGDTSLHVLTMPEGKVLRCRTPDSAFAPGLVTREFKIGDDMPSGVAAAHRELTLVYDSAGTPVLIHDEVTLVPLRSQMIMMRLAPDGSVLLGRRMDLMFDSATVASLDESYRNGDLQQALKVKPRMVKRDVTPAEARQGRQMAKWFWDRRCDRP